MTVFFLHLLLLGGPPGILAKSLDRATGSVETACEGAWMFLRCAPGHQIDIISADYGRLSKTVCKHSATTNTACRSPNALAVVKKRCQGSEACSVPASNNIFGDPCGGTHKYLQLTYSCKASCCTTCSLAFPATPPFGGTVHSMADTITKEDASTFVTLTYTGRDRVTMVGPNSEGVLRHENNVPVYQYTAVFSDKQSITVRCDEAVGIQKQCREFAETFCRALGRVPWYARSGASGLDLRPGDYSVKGCNAWAAGSTLGMCVGVGKTLEARGTLEELMMHEGAHATLGRIQQGEAWRCAQDKDQNFISTYARDFSSSEDVAESVVPWYAWRFSSGRVDSAIIAKITSAIPARLELLTSLLTSPTLREEVAARAMDRKTERQSGVTERPAVIHTYPAA